MELDVRTILLFDRSRYCCSLLLLRWTIESELMFVMVPPVKTRNIYEYRLLRTSFAEEMFFKKSWTGEKEA